MTTIPNSSSYEDILDGYFGDAYGDQQAGLVTQKDVLWTSFLLQNKLDPNDPLVVAQDPTILAKFVQFTQKTYDSMQTNALSPDEVARRDLMFSVHDLIVLMLETLQKSVGVLGDNVVFLGKYQREYANMMGRAAEAFYIGASRSLPSPNTGDLTKWTLGYEDITMQEYLDTAVFNSIAGQSSTPNGANELKLNSVNTAINPPNPTTYLNRPEAVLVDALQGVPQTEFIALGPLTRTVSSNKGPAEQNSMRINYTPNSVTFDYTYWQQYDATYTPFTFNNQGVPVFQNPVRISGFYPVVANPTTVTFPPGATEQEKLNLTNAAFQSFLATPLNTQPIVPPGMALPSNILGPFSNIQASHNQSLTVLSSQTQPVTFYNRSNIPGASTITAIRNLTIPWYGPYNTPDVFHSDETSRAYVGADVRRRGQVNSLLQQYVTNTQSRRQVVGNQSDAQQSQMDQARTGFTQAAGLLKTMIGQLSTILTSIFQVST